VEHDVGPAHRGHHARVLAHGPDVEGQATLGPLVDDFFRRDGPMRVLEAHVVLLRLIARKYQDLFGLTHLAGKQPTDQDATQRTGSPGDENVLPFKRLHRTISNRPHRGNWLWMESLIIKGKVHTGPRAMGRALGENPFEVHSTPEPGRPSPDRGKSHRAAAYHSSYHPVVASKLVADFGDPGDHVLPAPSPDTGTQAPLESGYRRTTDE